MPAVNYIPGLIGRIIAASNLCREASALAADVQDEITATDGLNMITDDDPVFDAGPYQGLTWGELANAVYALSAFEAAGATHATNLHKVRP